MSDLESDITENLLLNGTLRLRQPKRGHRAGHDAILLAAFTEARPGNRVIDFGAGVGAAGLALATRVPTAKYVLIEIDAALAEIARGNAHLNSLDAEVICLDITAAADTFSAAGLIPDSADVALMNPPFNHAARHRSSPDSQRQVAHVADEGMLGKWIHAARRILKPSGTLTLIWRADGLGEVLAGLERGFGAVNVLPVYPDVSRPAIRVLVSAIKGSGAPMSVRPGLVLNDAYGRPSEDAHSVLGGKAISLAAEGTGQPSN